MDLQPADLELPEKPSLSQVKDDLLSLVGLSYPASIVYGLSDLTEDEITDLRATWQNLHFEQRKRLLDHLNDVSETNIDLNFHALGRFALSDPSDMVRQAAVELLWEDDSPWTFDKLIDMVQTDSSAEVRCAAASAMEHHLLLGEYGKVEGSLVSRAQVVLMDTFHDLSEDIDVRRRALESIASSSHEDVAAAIDEAYSSDEPLLQQSAIYAMGKTADTMWAPIVLQELDSPDPAACYEAVRSAGELEIQEAVLPLGRLAVEGDREVNLAAIWSLGEIGGKQALRILSALAQDAERSEDPELLEAIEDAIGNASLVDDIGLLDLE